MWIPSTYEEAKIFHHRGEWNLADTMKYRFMHFKRELIQVTRLLCVLMCHVLHLNISTIKFLDSNFLNGKKWRHLNSWQFDLGFELLFEWLKIIIRQ